MVGALTEHSYNQREVINLTVEAADELTRIYTVSAYHYRDQGIAPLALDQEDGSLELFDSYQANLLRDCVVHNAGLSQNLYEAHDEALVFARSYNRQNFTHEQLGRVRSSKELCLDRIEIARTIGRQITKAFELSSHDFIDNPVDWHLMITEARQRKLGRLIT